MCMTAQVPALAADVQTPEYCALGEDEEQGGGLQAVNAWFGPSGTVTPLHTDPHHNLLAQVGAFLSYRELAREAGMHQTSISCTEK